MCYLPTAVSPFSNHSSLVILFSPSCPNFEKTTVHFSESLALLCSHRRHCGLVASVAARRREISAACEPGEYAAWANFLRWGRNSLLLPRFSASSCSPLQAASPQDAHQSQAFAAALVRAQQVYHHICHDEVTCPWTLCNGLQFLSKLQLICDCLRQPVDRKKSRNVKTFHSLHRHIGCCNLYSFGCFDDLLTSRIGQAFL